jgi:hypothetical protein
VVVARTDYRRRKGQSEPVVVLEREEAAFTCGGWGQQVVPEARPWRTQELQHLLFWEHVTVLRVLKDRVVCPGCGLKADRLPRVACYARVTTKLAALVGEL